MEMIRLQLLLLVIVGASVQAAPPNIVFIVADDLGWNDVGFRNPDIKSPILDKLAREGVLFNNAYVQPACTPSRHAFMTGTYPFRAGLQRGAMLPANPECSPLSNTLFPEKLQSLGYATHGIGKWHLGFCNWNCTPTYRGFDSFYGFYNGKTDYYTKAIANGTDFRDNKDRVKVDGTYSTYLHSKRATDIIKSHNVSKPLFLYMPFQNVHAPLQVPKQYGNMYPNIQDDGRRQFSGMVSAMDEAIGNITQALAEKGLMENTVIIFTADNGGWPTHSGNNYPLRGGKLTIFEGGTRASSFIYGAGLKNAGKPYNGLIHAVDWHPTIMGIAGGEPAPGIDGINQWEEIRTGKPSKRSEFVYNLDDSSLPLTGAAAIRVGDYKLISGFPGPYEGWYEPATVSSRKHPVSEAKKGQEATEEYEIDPYSRLLREEMAKDGGFLSSRLYQNDKSKDGLDPFQFQELYNLVDDPNERKDLSKELPEKVKEMKARLDEYRKNYVPPYDIFFNDPKADPKHYDGYWSPGWC